MSETLPKKRKEKSDVLLPDSLAAGRYGTIDMAQNWGPEATFEESLRSQGQASATLSELHPDIVPPDAATEINEKASLKHIDPDRIRELEEQTGHDVIAINTALEEKVSDTAKPHINKLRTSADTTQTARALQIKKSLEVITDSVENLRDILLEKAMNWQNIPHIDQTHLYDAMPTVAGRPLAFYAEMLQSNLTVLKFVYDNSLVGKWADATGNHHSAVTVGIDGIELQRKYCDDLGINHMIAPAQIPGLEFELDVIFALTRTAATMDNIADYFADGRGDDRNIFQYKSPRPKKGSSAMPHKDAKQGNPTAEEQVMSLANYMAGVLMTAVTNCKFPYARNLAGSASGRIIFEDAFKFLDHGIRRLAAVVYHMGIKEEESKARIERSYGVVTSPQVMTYLTDQRKVTNPMARSQAHDLLGELATKAWNNGIPFIDVLLENEEITSRLDEKTLREITDPNKYIGESIKIINDVYNAYHGKKTLGK